MKDIIIPAKRVKKELISLAICFLIAFAANVGAVIAYKSPAVEIISSLIYVLIGAVVLYLLWIFVRILFLLPVKFFRKSKK
jgi:membrane protein YdbS with pleckstrin-like domain